MINSTNYIGWQIFLQLESKERFGGNQAKYGFIEDPNLLFYSCRVLSTSDLSTGPKAAFRGLCLTPK